MLREVFRSEILYFVPPEDGLYYYHGMAIGTGEAYSNPDSQSRIFVTATSHMPGHLGWSDNPYWVVDGRSGKIITRVKAGSPGGSPFAGWHLFASRNQVFWQVDYYGQEIEKVNLGTEATAPVEKDKTGKLTLIVPKNATGWSKTGEKVRTSHFPIPPEGRHANFLGNIQWFDGVAIDDKNDIFLNGRFNNLGVWQWKSGKFLYDVETPGEVTAVCLEDETRAYVLCKHNVMMLFDYGRNEVLAVSRVPPPEGTKEGGSGDNYDYWNKTFIFMTWDPVYRRLLLLEDRNPPTSETPYAAADRIRGFRMAMEATRLTKPLPLKVPRQGRYIPVMAQVVDNLNQGVGAYTVTAEVTGDGVLAGIPITDYQGTVIAQVKCNDADLYSDYGYDTGSAGAALEAGSITVKFTAKSMVPSADMILAAGMPSPPPPETTTPEIPGGGTTPGGPEEGGGESLPSLAPNMIDVVRQVEASAAWNLAPGNETGPMGNGAFTEAVVTALHDQDPNWGHLRKNPGQTQYNGHAVDAAVWKDPDGKTGETIDFIAGTQQGYGGYVIWINHGRDTYAYEHWYY